jgi:Ca2+-binding RTX toxin-like protein
MVEKLERLGERRRRMLVAVASITTVGAGLVLAPHSSADTVSCASPTIVGTSGNDYIVGTPGPDVIAGGSGNDQIDAGAGDDVVCGESGNDQILTGNGNDRVDGGSGNDQIDSGAGDDVLLGDSGNDQLLAGSGDDSITTGSGNDNVDGGAGTDTCTDATAADSLVNCEVGVPTTTTAKSGGLTLGPLFPTTTVKPGTTPTTPTTSTPGTTPTTPTTKPTTPTTAGPTTTTTSKPPTIPNPTYNRQAAVNYALNHARDAQGAPARCTVFVSESLWAGALPRSTQWDTNTAAGKYVEDFIKYFKTNLSTQWIDITKNLKTNAVPEAEAGDLIVYDWENNGSLDHLTIITGFASGQYPLVSEQGQFDWNTNPQFRVVNPRAHYTQRGWTYSEMHKKYLQEDNPNMRAYLLKINGGYWVGTY